MSNSWSESRADDIERADQAFTSVLSRRRGNALAHFVKGIIYSVREQKEQAIVENQTTIDLNPNLALAHARMGFLKTLTGRSDEAFAPISGAIRLSPRDPFMNAWTLWVCNAHAQPGHDDEAIEWCRKSITIGPLWFAYVDLISAYGWKGQMEEARAASGELKKLMPNYTITRWMNNGWSDNAVC